MEYKIFTTDEFAASKETLVSLLEEGWEIINSTNAGKLRIEYILKKVK